MVSDIKDAIKTTLLKFYNMFNHKGAGIGGQCDFIFKASESRHLITVGFLKALLENLDDEKAFDLAVKGFTNYMTEYYNLVLGSTKERSQERFDVFRQHYRQASLKSPYCQIIKSTPEILEVRYDRCPFAEVAVKYNVFKLAYAFCLSDYEFTKNVLPGVDFQRKHEIIKEDRFCDHKWVFIK